MSALAACAVSVALAVPVHTANAAGGPVTQIIVWGDSMTQVWPTYLQSLVGIPVVQMGVGADNIQQTQTKFNSWVANNPGAKAATGHLCWCGHTNTNRKNNNPDTIVPTLQAMADRVPAGLFMPIGLTNGPDQGIGTEGYRVVVQGVNVDMKQRFGSSYAEVRRYLVTDGLRVAGITPTAEDRRNIDADVPPRSLRTDSGGNPAHLNDAGRQVTAQRLNDLVRAAGWIDGGQQEEKAASATAVTSTRNPSPQGSPVQATATVRSASAQSGTPTGTVQFKIDGRLAGPPVTLQSGVAVSRPTKTLSVGNHTITAVYSGNAVFASSTGQITQRVTAP
jgi:hypothetical protein